MRTCCSRFDEGRFQLTQERGMDRQTVELCLTPPDGRGVPWHPEPDSVPTDG